AFLPSCRIYEPDFTNCSTHSIQKLIDQLSIGIPEIVQSFGPFDPMHVRDIIFKQDNNEVATISANLTEVVVKGFSKTKIVESRYVSFKGNLIELSDLFLNSVSKKDFNWQTKIYLPKMRLDAKYVMAGRILLIPLSGAGNIFIEIENLDIMMYTKTHLYEKGGYTFYNVTAVSVKLEIGGLYTKLDNLFNGRSKEVEQSTNQFFNDNWQDFFEALRPLVVETVERTLLDLLQKMFHLMPANFFVEDIPNSLAFYGRKTKLIQ
ncbi:CG17189, partial [Drosophila busckii]